MVSLRLFASAREAAGTSCVEIDAESIDDVLSAAVDMFGADFASVLETSRIWLDGEPADRATPVAPDSEIAVLPPVSGGYA